MWEIPQWSNIMKTHVKSYDAKIDSKKRITLRAANYEYYHVQEMEDGKIVLEPRVLVDPFTISSNTLSMMDKSMANFKEGNVSPAVDLSNFE
jgi:hypothetical protein